MNTLIESMRIKRAGIHVMQFFFTPGVILDTNSECEITKSF